MKLKNHIVKNKEILWIQIIYTNYITQKKKKKKKKKKIEPQNGQIWKPDPEPSLDSIILDLYTQTGGSKAEPLSTFY